MSEKNRVVAPGLWFSSLKLDVCKGSFQSPEPHDDTPEGGPEGCICPQDGSTCWSCGGTPCTPPKEEKRNEI